MRRELAATVLGVVALACGGKSKSVAGEPREPAFPVPPSVPFACGGDTTARPLAHVSQRRVATGEKLRFESVSGDGAFVAYTALYPDVAIPGVGVLLKDLFVASVAGGEPTLVESQIQERPGDFELTARFEGRTLLTMWGVSEDTAQELWVWRPGDDGPTTIAAAVDPSAVRASRDGRFLSVEANDQDGDMVDAVDLLLVEVSTLERTLVAQLDRARARFTRDSSSLVYGGRAGIACPNTVERLSLVDRTVSHVACTDGGARWEISPDAEWLVHADRWSHFVPAPPLAPSCPSLLLKTPLAGGDARVLADCMWEASGKELDVARGGAAVSFVTRTEDALAGGARLMTVPLDGGEATELVPSDVWSILEHTASRVAFTRPGEDDCGDARFATVPAAGGPIYDLGKATDHCTDAPREGVLTELDGALLALSGDRELRFQLTPGEEPLLVGCSVEQAALLEHGIVLFSGTTEGVTGLYAYDANTGVITLLEPTISGKFGALPDGGGDYFVAVPDGPDFTLVHGTP